MHREQLLDHIDVARERGLEIGALNKPIITRAMGPIEYIDRATREELQDFYRVGHNIDPEDIVHVDHVWGEQRLIECVGGHRVYDYLVASHVIEHVPDLFGWLQEISEVLVDGGKALFVVPDKRFTFDFRRRTTGGAELVDAYVRNQRKPDARQIFDCFLHFRDPATGLDHAGQEPDEAAMTQRAREIMDLCSRIQTNGEYVDAHCWVFTPRSMLDCLDLASRLGVLPFEIAALEGTEAGHIDFLLSLRRLPDSLDRDAQREAFVASVKNVDLPEEADANVNVYEMSRLIAEAQAAIARASAIEASTSWRLTAPLRAAVMMARGLRGR